MKKRLYEIVGWAGMILILSAYGLLVADPMTSRGWLIHILNALGSIGVFLNAFKHGAHPAGVLNFIFLLFAILGIIRAIT